MPIGELGCTYACLILSDDGIPITFLDNFGDAQSVKKAEDRHAKLFLVKKNTSESKKHHADDILQSEKTKLAKSGVYASSSSVLGAYQSTQNQCPAGYDAQPQAWPQATQAQAQNWTTPAYTQHEAAYGAYGNAYAQPQVQIHVPQAAAAYGAYPPAYTVQVIIDVASPEAGVIQKFVANEGDTVEPGTKISIVPKSSEGVASPKKTFDETSSQPPATKENKEENRAREVGKEIELSHSNIVI